MGNVKGATPAEGPPVSLNIVLAFAFGVIFLAAILAIAVLLPNPTPQQFMIFRIVIAVAAAGVAAVIPGLLAVNLSAGKKLAIRAGGALAVLVIVYFFSPAGLVTDPAPPAPVTVTTEGDQSPGIAQNQGNMTISYGPAAPKP